MIQDYAKKNTSRPPRKWGKLITAIIICFAILIPSMFFIIHFHQTKQHIIKQPAKKPSKIKTTIKNQSTQFDFYTLLSKIKVPESAPNHSNQYILQIASLTTLEQAKDLIAELNKLGFRTFIQKHESSTHPQFRIMTGPYTTWETAKQAQKNLQDQHIKSILMKTQKTSS